MVNAGVGGTGDGTSSDVHNIVGVHGYVGGSACFTCVVGVAHVDVGGGVCIVVDIGVVDVGSGGGVVRGVCVVANGGTVVSYYVSDCGVCCWCRWL